MVITLGLGPVCSCSLSQFVYSSVQLLTGSLIKVIERLEYFADQLQDQHGDLAVLVSFVLIREGSDLLVRCHLHYQGDP